MRHYSPTERRWRLGLTGILAVYGWALLRSPESYTWSLLQLLAPAAFAAALWRQGDRHGATVPLWWLGQNCWNVSVYIRDARARELPLVGGGEHDWAIVPGELGLLPRDQAIGGAVYLAGVLIYGFAVVAGWRILTAAAEAGPKATQVEVSAAVRDTPE